MKTRIPITFTKPMPTPLPIEHLDEVEQALRRSHRQKDMAAIAHLVGNKEVRVRA